MINNTKIILFGGEGFLGKGLQDELDKRDIAFKSIDIMKDSIDLADETCIGKLVDELSDVTHVVLLASKLGAELFNDDSKAEEAYRENVAIAKNVLTAVKQAALRHSKKFSFTYYSSCELFGNVYAESKNQQKPYMISTSKKRYLYSKAKADFEEELKALLKCNDSPLSDVKIIRPFNVYGKGQKRGVAWKMVYDGLTKKEISYAGNTIRTMTSLRLASKLAIDIVLDNRNLDVNVVDERCCITMKTLAKAVQKLLVAYYGINAKLKQLPEDDYIRQRQIGQLQMNADDLLDIMEPDLLKLTDDLSISIRSK